MVWRCHCCIAVLPVVSVHNSTETTIQPQSLSAKQKRRQTTKEIHQIDIHQALKIGLILFGMEIFGKRWFFFYLFSLVYVKKNKGMFGHNFYVLRDFNLQFDICFILCFFLFVLFFVWFFSLYLSFIISFERR